MTSVYRSRSKFLDERSFIFFSGFTLFKHYNWHYIINLYKYKIATLILISISCIVTFIRIVGIIFVNYLSQDLNNVCIVTLKM